jgi:hypothetical protein
MASENIVVVCCWLFCFFEWLVKSIIRVWFSAKYGPSWTKCRTTARSWDCWKISFAW